MCEINSHAAFGSRIAGLSALTTLLPRGTTLAGVSYAPTLNPAAAIRLQNGDAVPFHVGKAASIGCIELPNQADVALDRLLAVGTPVIITDGPGDAIPNPQQFRR